MIVAAMGLDVMAAARSLLRTEENVLACEQLLASGQLPYYGHAANLHHSTCQRYAHLRQLHAQAVLPRRSLL